MRPRSRFGLNWGRCDRPWRNEPLQWWPWHPRGRDGPYFSGRRGPARFLEQRFWLLEALRQVFETNILIALALGHDAVVEGDAGVSTMLLVNFKTLRRFVAHIEAVGIAFRGQEDVILNLGIHGLREGGIEFDAGSAVRELTGAGILEPVLG